MSTQFTPYCNAQSLVTFGSTPYYMLCAINIGTCHNHNHQNNWNVLPYSTFSFQAIKHRTAQENYVQICRSVHGIHITLQRELTTNQYRSKIFLIIVSNLRLPIIIFIIILLASSCSFTCTCVLFSQASISLLDTAFFKRVHLIQRVGVSLKIYGTLHVHNN